MISDLQALRSFIAVVERGSVVAAARECGYSPAAVSRQLGRLQRKLGVTLFEPVGRGIRPTAHGVRLAEEARVFVAEARRFEDAARALAGTAASVPRGETCGPCQPTTRTSGTTASSTTSGAVASPRSAYRPHLTVRSSPASC